MHLSTHIGTGFGLGLLVLAAAASGLADDAWSVPADHSLVYSGYYALGVPSVEKAWSKSDYMHAVEILSGIERSKLPRHGSNQSGRLFAKLLSSQETMMNSIWEDARGAGEHVQRAQSAPYLTQLYGLDAADGLLFDRELLELHSEELGRRIVDLKDAKDLGERIASRWREEGDEAKRRELNDLRLSNLQLRRDYGELVSMLLLNILKLTEISATSDDTRLALRDHLVRFVPQALPHLSEAKRIEVVTALGEAAHLDSNAVIGNDLLDLAQLRVEQLN